jgi:hypothetical protein
LPWGQWGYSLSAQSLRPESYARELAVKIKNGMMGGGELDGIADKVKLQGDYMILYCHTEGKAHWNIQVAFDHRDITTLVKLIAFSSVPLFLISGFKSRNNPKPPLEF